MNEPNMTCTLYCTTYCRTHDEEDPQHLAGTSWRTRLGSFDQKHTQIGTMEGPCLIEATFHLGPATVQEHEVSTAEWYRLDGQQPLHREDMTCCCPAAPGTLCDRMCMSFRPRDVRF